GIIRQENPDVFPTDQYTTASTLNIGNNVDYLSQTPGTIIASLNYINYAPQPENSGYSTDGGHTFTKFTSYPFGGATEYGGNLAGDVASDIVFIEGSGNPPYCG